MKSPLVSIIMPVFNAEDFLRESIESILNQSYKSFELIIVNDNSNDKSKEIISYYARKDNRIKLIENKATLGNYLARNIGIKDAAGSYIANMDADDISTADRIESQVNFLEGNKDIGLCTGNILIINLKGEVQTSRSYPLNDTSIRKSIFTINPFPNGAIMCRKEVFEIAGMYSNEFKSGGDFEMWVRALKYFKAGNVNKIIYKHRIVDKSVSRINKLNTELNILKVRYKTFKEYGMTPSLINIFFNLIEIFTLIFVPNTLRLAIYESFFKRK